MKNFKIKILTLVMSATVAMSSMPAFAKTNTTTKAVTLNSATKIPTISSTTKLESTIIASFACQNGMYCVSSGVYVGYGYQTSGTNVRVIQAALNLAGYNAGDADGNFSDKTQDALEDFQLKYFGYTDKVAGPKTWGKLTEVCYTRVLAINI